MSHNSALLLQTSHFGGKITENEHGLLGLDECEYKIKGVAGRGNT